MTPQSKALIFGRYLGQQVYSTYFKTDFLLSPLQLNQILNYDSIKDYSLLLTSLEDITEEHAIECAMLGEKFAKKHKGGFEVYKGAYNNTCVKSDSLYNIFILKDGEFSDCQAQYLIAKGYAVRQLVIEDGKPRIYTVQELIKEGVITIKNK